MLHRTWQHCLTAHMQKNKMDSEAARHLVEYTVPVAEPGRSAPSNRGMAELENAMGALSAQQAPIAGLHDVGRRGQVRQATLSVAVAHTGTACASGMPVGGRPVSVVADRRA